MTQEQREKLERAAKELAKSKPYIDSDRAFIKGAEWMEQNQWIPVTETLPAKGEPVLIAEPSAQANGDILYDIQVSHWDGTYYKHKDGRKEPQFPDGQDEQPGYYWPSHWKELPSPPKPQTNAGK